MLLPGANLIILFFVILLYCGAILSCGALMGGFLFKVVPELIEKTKAAKHYHEGRKGAYRWYLSHTNWFRIGVITGAVLSAYTLGGPFWHLIDKLWRL